MMLELQNISKKFDSTQLIKDVSLTLSRGEVKGLLGPNGAGKTTLFSMIIGLVPPTTGKVLLDGLEISSLSASERIHRGLCYLPQESSLFLDMSVLDNILCVLELKGKLSSKQRYEEAMFLLETMNIQHLVSKKSILLSGGQRRRVEFARLLASKPHYVLLDEPFAGVDPLSIDDIQEQIKILQTHHIGILISDHNVEATLDICDSSYVMSQGQIIAQGSKDEIYNNEKAQEFYFGS
jgi:lipopolysaccharide export system ATP-binding protein